MKLLLPRNAGARPTKTLTVLTVRVTGKRIGGRIKTALSQAREQVNNSPDTFEVLTTDQRTASRQTTTGLPTYSVSAVIAC